MRSLSITQTITNRDAKSIDKYLNEISKYDVLSPEEEVELFQKYQNGCERSFEKIINHNLRFVVSVAKQYSNSQGLRLGDAINEGNLGLIKAAKRFDTSRGFKFISYAVWWIRQSIIAALNDKNGNIRVPSNMKILIRKIKVTQIEFLQNEGREPSLEEISSIMEIPVHRIKKCLEYKSRCASLDAPFNAESESSLLNTLEDTDNVPPDYKLDHTESIKVDVSNLLSTLNDRECQILKMNYGLGYNRENTLQEISDVLGTSRERVRQIKSRALKKLTRKSHLVSAFN